MTDEELDNLEADAKKCAAWDNVGSVAGELKCPECGGPAMILGELGGAQWSATHGHPPFAPRPGAIVELIERLRHAEKELAELEATFELRWQADQRAIGRWRAEKPIERDLKWPDHADLVVWLTERLVAAERQRRLTIPALPGAPSPVQSDEPT